MSIYGYDWSNFAPGSLDKGDFTMHRNYNYPVWATQGGGLAREVNGKQIFIEKPDCPGLDIGDDVPAEWDLVPVNEMARKEMEKFEPGT